MQYSQEYDERLPLGQTINVTDAQPWPLVLQPYLKSTNLFICPSNSASASNLGSWTAPSGSGGVFKFWGVPASYLINDHLGTDDTSAASPSVALSTVSAPATRILVVDAAHPNGWQLTIGVVRSWIPNMGFDVMFAGHLGTTNCLFLDGHVKAMRPTATMTPVNMWGRSHTQTAADGPGCDGTTNPRDPNCEAPDAAGLAALKLIEDKYK